ncbi:MAG: helix-turn-helix domain-containing protein [Clostridiales bacterium]|jgi:transcriptional regulator with XRE-family HTH domain|nr:helix-turn-helix domain-containing protein [Clostridiales bacterium]
MMIKIGAQIKSLRKKKDVTQDRLAEYLGVTPQAVSRWESEICYPDIEMLPPIADFFNVSLDDLAGINQKRKEENINMYIEMANKEQCCGNFAQAVSIYREAVSQYPSSHKLQAFLASAIGCMDNGVKISTESANEAIAICCRILDDCLDDDVRYNAMSILCWVYYRQLDDLNSAMEFAGRFPKIYGCQELIQSEILKIRMPSEKAEEFVFSYISALLITFNKTEFAYCNNKKVMLEMLIRELNNLLSKLSG